MVYQNIIPVNISWQPQIGLQILIVRLLYFSFVFCFVEVGILFFSVGFQKPYYVNFIYLGIRPLFLSQE